MGFIVDFDSFGCKLDPNSDVVLVSELSLDVFGEDGCLSDT